MHWVQILLYLIRYLANDDWYWLYATVAANRNSFAVTNDLTRDHRLAFLESRMYMRWRNNHIIHFDFDKALETRYDSAALRLTYPGAYLMLLESILTRFNYRAVLTRGSV